MLYVSPAAAGAPCLLGGTLRNSNFINTLLSNFKMFSEAVV